MPPKKHIIIIGALGLLSFFLGYWHGKDDLDIFLVGMAPIIGLLFVYVGLREAFLNRRRRTLLAFLVLLGILGIAVTNENYLFFYSSLAGMIGLFAYWVACATGLWQRLILDPFGFVMKKLANKTKCKRCKETIKTDALICKHCGMMLKDEETVS